MAGNSAPTVSQIQDLVREASERFPDRRHWDHAIDLKEDAPTTINCRVYPLSPMEKEEQRKFIDSNLHLQRI
jgi:hypothetical protein